MECFVVWRYSAAGSLMFFDERTITACTIVFETKNHF